MLYEVRTERLIATEPWAPLRVAELEDVESLVKLDRDMVTEEVGFDPFEPVMDSYRQGWLRRVREGRAWVVGPVGGPLIFKVDQSAVSQAAVQLAGIYTVPERRREGLASAGIGEMCRRLLDRHARVTLYVGGSNTPAIKLYEALGFEPIALVRSAWFAM